MAEENKPEEEIKELTIQEPGGKNPLLLVVLLLNTIVMGGVGYMQFTSHQKMMTQPSVADLVDKRLNESVGEDGEVQPEDKLGLKAEEDGLLLPLDGFTANLAQGDGPRRFVRLNAVLKFSKQSQEEEFKARKPQIRDSIISILNAKRPSDLLKREGKEYLKEEIKAAINTYLVDGKVIDVFYVGFQIN